MPTVYERRPGSSRGSWDKDNMAEAIEKVQSKEMNIREAAGKYQMPFRTLHCRLKSAAENVSLGPEDSTDSITAKAQNCHSSIVWRSQNSDFKGESKKSTRENCQEKKRFEKTANQETWQKIKSLIFIALYLLCTFLYFSKHLKKTKL